MFPELGRTRLRYTAWIRMDFQDRFPFLSWQPAGSINKRILGHPGNPNKHLLHAFREKHQAITRTHPRSHDQENKVKRSQSISRFFKRATRNYLIPRCHRGGLHLGVGTLHLAKASRHLAACLSHFAQHFFVPLDAFHDKMLGIEPNSFNQALNQPHATPFTAVSPMLRGNQKTA